MNPDLIQRTKAYLEMFNRASAERDAEINEYGFEKDEERWFHVMALMPPVRELVGAIVQGSEEIDRLAAELDEARAELEEARLTLAAEKQRRSRMPSDNPDRLLAEVNAERIRRNLSWRDLATRLDVAPSTLTRWNNGRWPSIAVYLNAREWLAGARAAADTYDTSK